MLLVGVLVASTLSMTSVFFFRHCGVRYQRWMFLFLTVVYTLFTAPFSQAQDVCSILFSQQKIFHIKNSKEQWDRAAQKIAARGLFAAKIAYLKRKTLSKRRAIWDLAISQAESAAISESVDYISWVSDEKTPVSEVAESIRMDNENSPRGLGWPHMRILTDIITMADSLSEKVAKDVYGSVVIWYDLPEIKLDEESFKLHQENTPDNHHVALIGRLFIEKNLSASERMSFYQQIALRLQQKNVKEIFIEVVDRSHVSLYRRLFSLEVVEKFNGKKYNMEDVTIMKVSLETFLHRTGLHQN